MSQYTREIQDLQFDHEVLGSDGLTMVDFWAEWCGPCKTLGPVVDSIAQEYGARAQVLKMDVDRNPDTAVKLGIRGLPTVILFKNGQEVDRIVGAQPKDIFVHSIERHLK